MFSNISKLRLVPHDYEGHNQLQSMFGEPIVREFLRVGHFHIFEEFIPLLNNVIKPLLNNVLSPLFKDLTDNVIRKHQNSAKLAFFGAASIVLSIPGKIHLHCPLLQKVFVISSMFYLYLGSPNPFSETIGYEFSFALGFTLGLFTGFFVKCNFEP